MIASVNKNVSTLISMTKTNVLIIRVRTVVVISLAVLIATVLVYYGPAVNDVKPWYHQLILFILVQMVLYLFWWILQVVSINSGGQSTVFALNCIKQNDWHWIEINPFCRPSSINPIVTTHPSFRYVIGSYLEKCNDPRAKILLDEAVNDLAGKGNTIVDAATQTAISDLVMPSSLKRIGALFTIVYFVISIVIAMVIILYIGSYLVKTL